MAYIRLPRAGVIRKLALLGAVPFLILAVFAFQSPSSMAKLAHGPLLADHQGISCGACHLEAEGTTRQQIQANLHHLLRLRADPVDFGYQPVMSAQCLACHARPNERHPIYRFREPRFSEALSVVDATNCLGCHGEHTQELSFAEIGFCRACHQDLKLRSDPIRPSHAARISSADWAGCLTCHDYHGNHAFKAPVLDADAASVDAIRRYLISGPSPYGDKKIYEGSRE